MISEYDEIKACHTANYRYYHDWRELTAYQRAKLVAHYLLDRHIEAHKSDAEQSELERKAKH